MADEEKSAAEAGKDVIISAEKIYIKDASFEAPNSPKIFQKEWEPQLNVEVGQKYSKLEEDTFDVVLTVTATVKIDSQTVYLAEVHQGGVFVLRGMSEDSRQHMLNVFCPRTLYPYASATIADLVMRGGFPQLLLAPISFEAVYKQRMEQQQESGDNSQPG